VSTHSISVFQQQSSVFEVVKLVDTELHDLLARREEINSRIQNLHQVMYGLREMVKYPEFGELKPNSTEFSNASGRAVRTCSSAIHSDCVGPGVRSQNRCESGKAYLRLIRACRIALIESEGTASVNEIYSRIVRRGSFSFLSFEFAAPMLLHALHVMTVQGEIRCVKDGPHQCWNRVTNID
jgi:hypothetical protein